METEAATLFPIPFPFILLLLPSSVEFRGVTVRAPGGRAILEGLDLHIGAGEAVAFLGRSGAGKTTTLKLINGMVRPDGGSILINDVPLEKMDLIGLRRRTGYVIQGVGLFPHRTIYDNVATVPRLLGWEEKRIRDSAAALMESLGIPLERFGARFPRSLSGGEQQRAGIARATIAEPGVLLCDEPFAALDPIVRREQQEALISLRAARSATIIFVTHDLREALRVTERIVLIDGGRITLDLPASQFLEADHPLARQFVEATVQT